MIALLLAGLAFAQDGWFDNPKNQCSTDDAFPIAGTAGFANTLAALRTNAATYSASAYAERHGLRRIALDDDVKGVVLMEMNYNLGVTRVPVFQEDATYGECPAAYTVGTRPVDLYAYNVGFAYRYGRIGAFYASSVTMGYPAELAYLRAYQTVGTSFVGPMMNLFVPFVGSFQTATGASAYAQDFVAGVIVDAEVAHLRGGYTQSRGWYLSGQDKYVGLFGSIIFRDGIKVVGQFRGGLERTPLPGGLDEKVGRPSLFARVLPLTESTDPQSVTQVDLTTGHLEQEGIAGLVDVRGAYAIKPVAQLHEASVGVHDKGWYAIEDGQDPAQMKHFYAEAGFVTLPAQYYYGLEGGTVLQARAEYQHVLTNQEKVPVGAVHVTAMFNDPEQTALYPFAVNNLAVRFQVKAAM